MEKYSVDFTTEKERRWLRAFRVKSTGEMHRLWNFPCRPGEGASCVSRLGRHRYLPLSDKTEWNRDEFSAASVPNKGMEAAFLFVAVSVYDSTEERYGSIYD